MVGTQLLVALDVRIPLESHAYMVWKVRWQSNTDASVLPIERQTQALLPGTYFLITFTLPA